jgi:hypothetical protein
MVQKGLLFTMKHPAPGTRRAVSMFRVSPEGQTFIDLYRRHAEAQEDLDDVLELL